MARREYRARDRGGQAGRVNDTLARLAWDEQTNSRTLTAAWRAAERWLEKRCPGPRCLTLIPPDRDLCHFCRRGERM